MANQTDRAASLLPGALARPDWRPGGALTASELRLQHAYERQRLRRHLRLVHGWGVVCGLNLVAANYGDGWDLFVCPRYGIGPCGDEILLQDRLRFDLWDYLWTQPVDRTNARAWIALAPAEADAAFQPAPRPACGCGCRCDTAEIVSRRSDTVIVVVSWAAPVLPQGTFNLCRGGTPRCPICPPDCGLPLGSVALPSSLPGS